MTHSLNELAPAPAVTAASIAWSVAMVRGVTLRSVHLPRLYAAERAMSELPWDDARFFFTAEEALDYVLGYLD
ncbi:hypothetical protein DESA109040_14990 [Deinococcus saxicola]|uniref:hypothetical protein n=1 Tax=Deinococcus saxicola TaxID=249406 RepID=UPI0039EF8B46